ncbi:unnamed protein product [Cochlearia groenlandica]
MAPAHARHTESCSVERSFAFNAAVERASALNAGSAGLCALQVRTDTSEPWRRTDVTCVSPGRSVPMSLSRVPPSVGLLTSAGP